MAGEERKKEKNKTKTRQKQKKRKEKETNDLLRAIHVFRQYWEWRF